MTLRPTAVGLAERLFAAALVAVPEPLRGLYRGEMQADFGALIRETAEAGDAVWWATARAVADVLRMGMTERARRGPFTRWMTRWDGIREGMMDWFREFRTAGRSLMRRPGFALIAVITLALGIGANVAIFTVVDSVLLRPLPFPDSHELVEIRHHAPAIGLDELNNSEGTLVFYREQADFLEGFAAWDAARYNLAGQQEPVRVFAVRMTPDLLDVLRVRPALGRPFTADDGLEGAPQVAILSHAFWSAQFGSDPEVVGRTIRLDDMATEVVGVMPPEFRFPRDDTDVFLPLPVGPEPDFGSFGMAGIGRLGPGISLETAQQRVTDLQNRIPEAYPAIAAEQLEGWGWSGSVRTLKVSTVGDSRTTSLVVLGPV